MQFYEISKNQIVIFLFILVNFFLRVILSILEVSNIDFTILPGIVVGAFSDFVTVTYLLPIFFAFNLFKQPGKKIQNISFFAILFFLFFFAFSEFTFWREFSSRFNFVAVDYLIYTKEVIGNILESYNMTPIVISVAFLAFVVTCILSRFKRYKPVKISWKNAAISFVLPVLSFYLFDSSYLEISSNNYVNEISKNGLYELFSAYRNNSLSFEKFYITKDQKDLTQNLRSVIKNDEENITFVSEDNILRQVSCNEKEKKLNVVIITIESLSASFMQHFGNKENITPNLDSIFDQSLSFTNIRAVGTRTVFGLDAISLSIPPLPGNAIIRRQNNENLQTLGGVLNSKGYDCKFIYGGFGYFDNMNYFFENNGCKIIDRATLRKDEVTFSNIWGVCDENILDKALKEAELSYESKKPFFSIIMTTTNHRPYTYPDGRIDIPSKTGRNGGVKYTDYAVGKFIEKAKKQPWFKDTIFVITADHTAGAARKFALDPDGYHIPLMIFSPGHIKPFKINKLASQIDIAPTLLALLNVSYEKKFFGHDILTAKKERAFISNYQQVGYISGSKLLVLKPMKKFSVFEQNGTLKEIQVDSDNDLLKEALSYIQSASNWRTWNKK